VLRDSERPFGLVHHILARGIVGVIKTHQGLTKPKQLAAVWLASGALKTVQKSVEAINDIAAGSRAGGGIQVHAGLYIAPSPIFLTGQLNL
jgi:hypothetical protein